MKNFYEQLLHDTITDALKFKRTIRNDIYSVVKDGKTFKLYDTDFYMGIITVKTKGDVLVSFNMVAKTWQKGIIKSAIENEFDIIFIKNKKLSNKLAFSITSW